MFCYSFSMSLPRLIVGNCLEELIQEFSLMAFPKYLHGRKFCIAIFDQWFNFPFIIYLSVYFCKFAAMLNVVLLVLNVSAMLCS